MVTDLVNYYDTSASTWYTGIWPYTTNTFSYVTYSKEKVYLYQIHCPEEDCGKTNWLELDKITACTKCGAKLKAVSQKVDHEIQIEE